MDSDGFLFSGLAEVKCSRVAAELEVCQYDPRGGSQSGPSDPTRVGMGQPAAS